jgi:SCY1-like protein 1
MWSFFSRDPAKDFPYEIGEPVDGLNKSIWSLHKAKRKTVIIILTCFILLI